MKFIILLSLLLSVNVFGNNWKVNDLGEGVIHVELAKSPIAEGPIWSSPMVKKNIELNQALVENIDWYVDHQSCLVFKAPGAQIDNKLCPTGWTDENWGGLTFETPKVLNIQGLGQYFVNPGEADGDWVGRVWDPLMYGHGNSLRTFSKGANGYTQIPVAYFLREKNEHFAIFVDHTKKQLWQFNQSPWRLSTSGTNLRFFVILGSSPRELRAKYMKIVGRPLVPPKSSFGLWVSEFGYDNWEEVDKVLSSLEADEFPVDGFPLDLQWFGGTFYHNPGDDRRGSRFGKLEFDENNFPDAKERVAYYQKVRGVNFMPIEESYISKFLTSDYGHNEYDLLAEHGFLAKDQNCDSPAYLDANPWWGVGGMVDWTNDEAGLFWHNLKRQKLVEMGIQFHWADLGEPEMYRDDACYYGFPELGQRDHASIHNVYNLKWIESIYNGYESNQNELRPFIMSRSGAAGIQRFGAGMWSGDIGANFNALTAHLNAQLHMTMSGIDYYGSDIGGFHRRPETLDGDANILFTQWFANSSLFDVPVRSHTWNIANELETSPNKIGDKISNRYNIRTRYELVPYYYSLAHQAYNKGQAVIAPMSYEFPYDLKVRTMGNQKMIGPYLMAAVVARYGEYYRNVYFPRGRWYNYRTLEVVESEGEVVNNIPALHNNAFTLPLFARAGSIIPLSFVTKTTRNVHGHGTPKELKEALRLRVFAGERATEFTVFEDDGKTTAYQSGQVAMTAINQKLIRNQLRVKVGPTRGAYNLIPANRKTEIEVVSGKSVDYITKDDQFVPNCSEAILKFCWTQNDNGSITIFGEKELRETLDFKISFKQSALTTKAKTLFICRNAKTQIGESVYISGNTAKLGNFDNKKAVLAFPVQYPDWAIVVDDLPQNTQIEWKCLIQSENTLDDPRFMDGANKVFKTTRQASAIIQDVRF